MVARLIATTFPDELGYTYYQNLDGYYWAEDPELDVDAIKPLYDRYKGWIIGYEMPDGTETFDLYECGVYPFDGDQFDMELQNIRSEFDSAEYGYVASGYAGTWEGRLRGGKIIEDMKELRATLSGYDDVTIKDEEGELVLYMYHHDGTNVLTLRRITPEGQRWMDDNIYADRETLVETLFNNPAYSVPPHIADMVYGSIYSPARRSHVSSMSKRARKTKTNHRKGQIGIGKDKPARKQPRRRVR